MALHVVIDTKGNGRLLGVFDSRTRAEQVVALSPLYYKLHSASLNTINAEALDWADDEKQRHALRQLMEPR